MPGDKLSINVGDGVSRREVVKAIGAASVLTTSGLAGCQSQGDGGSGSTETPGPTGTASDSRNNNVPDYQIVELIPPPTELSFDSSDSERELVMASYDASTNFFTPIIAGLHDAASKLDWSAQFIGPSEGPSVDKHVDMLNSTVSSNPAAIISNFVDDSAYDDVITRALDNDIPVFINTTNAYTREQMRNKFGRILPYIGQDLFKAGYVAGLTAIDFLPDDANSATIGTIDPAHQGLQSRAEGIQLAFEHNRPDVEFTQMVDYGANPSEGVNTVQNHLTANPDVDAFLSTDALTWVIGKALKQQGMDGDVVTGGFDLVTNVLDQIQNGTTHFTIGQDPYSQGFMSTMMMYSYLDRGIPGKDYITGAEVITEENVEFAKSRSGSWGTLREWQRGNYNN